MVTIWIKIESHKITIWNSHKLILNQRQQRGVTQGSEFGRAVLYSDKYSIFIQALYRANSMGIIGIIIIKCGWQREQQRQHRIRVRYGGCTYIIGIGPYRTCSRVTQPPLIITLWLCCATFEESGHKLLLMGHRMYVKCQALGRLSACWSNDRWFSRL